MQALFRVVIDGGAKVLKITARASVRPSPFGIGPTRCACNLVELPGSEEFEQPSATLGRLFRAGLMRRNVGQIDADDIGDRDFINIPLAASRRVFARDVGGKGFLSL